MCLALATLFVALIPGMDSRLELSRSALAAGEGWRLVTGHLVHFGTGHLVWDLVVFSVLGAFAEARGRRRLLLLLGIASLGISVGVLLCVPLIDVYRGLSGLDCALFGLLAADLFWDAMALRKTSLCWWVGLGVVGFCCKTLYEVLSSQTFFVHSNGDFAPVPIAHLIGFLLGVGHGLCSHFLHPFECSEPEKVRKIARAE